MKQKYEKPQMRVYELRQRTQLMQASNVSATMSTPFEEVDM